MKGDQDMKWYVIRAATGKEKKMKETIEYEIKRSKLEENVTNILIPTQKVIQLRKGKKVSIEKNYFPGYVLIECESVKEVVPVVKNIAGVLGFLGGRIPQPLSDAEVERILGRESQKDSKESFIVGQQVGITDGPFTSFRGDITHVDEKTQKVKINVKIFGRDVPVELNYMQIEK